MSAVNFITVCGIAAIFRHGGRAWIYMRNLLPCWLRNQSLGSILPQLYVSDDD